ncbi:metal ABC transporter permease [Methylicorpusculum oleiharenae]|uniref:metal ABC transporter permease n=1 Tax=Methylicorpusculum oleiharenae TaxID=1338687 RepID=UPI00135BDF57|nr:metal ABC transporter permease [Methylicorpusculum oleiharenae]MCD2451686.1 metal ABC transporter permease [Methylicorpusculum oleiharenae]
MSAKIILALILGSSVGAVSGYLGSLMLTKRMTLMGGALGHLALPGIALALLYDFDVSLGASLFLALGVLTIGYLERKTGLHLEALTAVVFSASLATAFLFLPKEELDIALLGNVSQISSMSVLITVLLSLVLYGGIKSIYSDMVLASISADLAQINGVNLKFNNTLYLICIAVTVALGVRIVGGLMTAALLAIPACTAKNISSNLHQYSIISTITGALACILGIVSSTFTAIPAGPLIIIASALLFLISVVKKFQKPMKS